MDIIYDRIIEGNKHLIKAAGLSTEVPPTTRGGEKLASGSQYWQVDSGRNDQGSADRGSREDGA